MYFWQSEILYFVPCRTWSRPWTDGTGCWGCSISWKNVSGLWLNPANNQYYIHWQMPPNLQINWMKRYSKIKKVDRSSSNLILGIKFAILAIQSLFLSFRHFWYIFFLLQDVKKIFSLVRATGIPNHWWTRFYHLRDTIG